MKEFYKTVKLHFLHIVSGFCRYFLIYNSYNFEKYLNKIIFITQLYINLRMQLICFVLCYVHIHIPINTIIIHL